jgi:hypothetical protein
MTFKYVFVLCDKRLAGFSKLFSYCHVPLDNILVGQLKPYGFHWKTPVRSRITEYDSYLERRIWARTKFDLLPWDAEFHLWMKKDIRQNFRG